MNYKRLIYCAMVITLIFTTLQISVVTADIAPKVYDPSTSLLYDDFTTGFGNGTGKYTDMSNFALDADGPWETPTYGTIAKSVHLDQFADGSLTYYNENFGNALFSMIVRFNSGYTSSDAFNWIFADPKVRWRDNALKRDGKRYEIYAGPDLEHLNRVTVTDFTYYTEMNGGNGGKDLFIEYEIEALPADAKYVKVVFKTAEYSNPYTAMEQTGLDWNGVKDLYLDPTLEKAARIVITDDKSKKTTKPVLTSDDFTTGTNKMFSYLEVDPFGIGNTYGVYQDSVDGLTMGRKNDSKWDATIRLCAYRIDDPLTATFSIDAYYWPMGNNGGTLYNWHSFTTDVNAPEGHAAQLTALLADKRLQVWESADGMVFTQCNNVSIDMYPSSTWNWTGPFHKAVYNVTGFKADTKFVQIVSPDYQNTEMKKSDPSIGAVRLTHSGPAEPVNEISNISVASNLVTGVRITSDSKYEGVVIVGVYDADNNLLASDIKTVAAADYEGNIANVDYNLTIPEGGTKIKAFFWDSLSTIKPLVDSLSL